MLKFCSRRSFQSWQFPTKITSSLPVFTVTPSNGFLPTQDPIVNLPAKYDHLNEILDTMSLIKPDGSKGSLALGQFGKAVESLPLYDLSKITDQRLLMALFRDYTFATSAYLLEPCDIMNKTKGTYGRGREILPKQLAIPLQIISDKINAKPFMEYAQSYALYNYKKVDQGKKLEYDNLELVRKFSGMKSEHGFILVHVDMVPLTITIGTNLVIIGSSYR
jgi:indoleamine 2,3-dioxygenase